MNQLITLESFAMQPMDTKILALNDISREHGLVLTAEDARELSDLREKCLKENERIEIGLGAVEGIIRRFSASAFVNQENYAYVLSEITDIFYYIKTETDDKISDEALLNELFVRFEQRCRGAVDMLIGREAEIIIRKVNAGKNYEAWYGAEDDADSSRDTDINALRDASGAVTPYLTTEDGDAVTIANYYTEESDEEDKRYE